MRGDEQTSVAKIEPVMDGGKLAMRPFSMRIKRDGGWQVLKLR
jgi:hypothetical protein